MKTEISFTIDKTNSNFDFFKSLFLQAKIEAETIQYYNDMRWKIWGQSRTLDIEELFN